MNSVWTKVVIIGSVVLSLGTGCANHNELQQPAQSSPTEQAEQILFTSTVVSKTIKSDKFIIEISSQDRHEYIEVLAILWDRIQVNDTIGLNELKELISINNAPIE